MSASLYSQHNVDTSVVTIKKEKTSIPLVLEEITKQTNIRFFYSSDFFAKEEFSVDFVNASVVSVLNELFGDKLSYDFKGEAVVVYRDKTQLSVMNKAEEDKRGGVLIDSLDITNVNKSIVPEADYQVRYDTVLVHDTVTIRDTITNIDTVYIRPVVKNPYRRKRVFRNTRLGDAKSRKIRFEPYYEQYFLLPNYSGKEELTDLYEESEKGLCFNFKIGADVGYKFDNILLTTGLGYRNVVENFKYSYHSPEISYYQQDTLDTYYTLQGTDTTWYYVMDSTYITQAGRTKEYDLKNRYHFIEIPAVISYLIEKRDWNIRIKGGLISSFLISSGGYYIKDEETFPIVKIDKSELNNFSADIMLATDIIYKLGNGYSVVYGMNYRTNLVSVFPEKYPVKKGWNTIGLHLGFQIDF